MTRLCVVGAGVVGLSTAVCIAESMPRCAVTVLADRFTPNTTSDVAAGILLASEYPNVPLAQQQRWFRDTFDHMRAIADSPEASEAGVFLISGYQIFKDTAEYRAPYWAECVLGFRAMTEKELARFPQYKFGQAFTTIKCECSAYLPWLHKRLKNAGGIVETRRVTDLPELSRSYDILVNCSGLGARILAGDGDMQPVRGQILRVHAPWLKHFVRVSDGQTYIYPGRESVTLGGTRQTGDWRLEADAGESEQMWERCCQLEPSLHAAHRLGVWVGHRPGRKSPRLEIEVLQLVGRKVPVIHNYGHGGCGVTLSWGTALEVMQLVRRCLNDATPPSRL